MYISTDDLQTAMSRSELIQTSNDDARAAAPNEDVLDAAVRYACDLTDGYLRGRYDLPLAGVPTILPPVCINLARYYLHNRRVNRAEFPKHIADAYAKAVKTLEDIRDGKIHLGIDTVKKTGQPERGAYAVRARAKQDWSGY